MKFALRASEIMLRIVKSPTLCKTEHIKVEFLIHVRSTFYNQSDYFTLRTNFIQTIEPLRIILSGSNI